MLHRGFPVTTLCQTVLDFAATGARDLLRLVLANADYHELLDVTALQRTMGQGVPGIERLPSWSATISVTSSCGQPATSYSATPGGS